MNKADYKFHRDKKQAIESQARQSEGSFTFWKEPTNRPIFIPKKKKHK